MSTFAFCEKLVYIFSKQEEIQIISDSDYHFKFSFHDYFKKCNISLFIAEGWAEKLNICLSVINSWVLIYICLWKYVDTVVQKFQQNTLLKKMESHPKW